MRTSRMITPILVASAAGGAIALSTGSAYALLPNYPATIDMTITNNTRYTMHLDGSDNSYGDWIVAPPAQLEPGQSETVSASTWNQQGFGIDVRYGMSEDTSAVFSATNYRGIPTTYGTRVEGANPLRWNVFSSVNQDAPNMSAYYTLLPPLR